MRVLARTEWNVDGRLVRVPRREGTRNRCVLRATPCTCPTKRARFEEVCLRNHRQFRIKADLPSLHPLYSLSPRQSQITHFQYFISSPIHDRPFLYNHPFQYNHPCTSISSQRLLLRVFIIRQLYMISAAIVVYLESPVSKSNHVFLPDCCPSRVVGIKSHFILCLRVLEIMFCILTSLAANL